LGSKPYHGEKLRVVLYRPCRYSPNDPIGKFCLKKSSVDFSNKINILLNNAVHGYEIKPFSICGARHRLSAGCVNPCTYGICPAAAATTAAEWFIVGSLLDLQNGSGQQVSGRNCRT
jgi:hypothetical protein